MMKTWLLNLFEKNKEEINEDTFSISEASEILKRRDLNLLKQYLLKYQDNWNYRYFISLAMSRNFPIEKIEKWVYSCKKSSDANLIYGARLLKEAWNARGYGRGNKISREKWHNFYALLDKTEDTLLNATIESPDDPTPWVLLIIVAVYRNTSPELEERYFQEAISRDPENWHAHINKLTGLSKKYGGSHEEMFCFARKCRANITDKSILNCLILKAHSEYWKYLNNFEENTVDANAYQKNKEAISECLCAYNQSLFKSNDSFIDTLFARINAAGTFWIFRQKEYLKKELEILENHLYDVHWKWIGTWGELEEAKLFAFG